MDDDDNNQLVNVGEVTVERRPLILISKVLQNISNQVEFGDKEEYMTPLNSFISSHFELMQNFFDKLITISEFPLISMTFTSNSESSSSNTTGNAPTSTRRSSKPRSYYIAASKLQERVTIHQHAIIPIIQSDAVRFYLLFYQQYFK